MYLFDTDILLSTVPEGLFENKWISRDFFLNLVVSNVNSTAFAGFLGRLDSTGNGAAQLNTLGSIHPSFVGTTLYFAYAVDTSPWGFPSNPVKIVIVP